MTKKIEDMLTETQLNVPSVDMKKRILDQAQAAWTESSVEQQLERCRLLEAPDSLKAPVLSHATGAWQRPRPILKTLRRWACATAAVLAFAVLGGIYDTYQSHAEGGSPVATSEPVPDEEAAAIASLVDLDDYPFPLRGTLGSEKRPTDQDNVLRASSYYLADNY
ncbi:hypothetical protein BVY04_03105 [bacterium M21]|nr:hypothetical protein BVY04_03105 [bacterium M21]